MSARGLVAPEHALALALAGTSQRREANRSAIAELASRADFDVVEELLRAQGMLSLIGGRLVELVDSAPVGFVEQVHEYRRLARRQAVEHHLITVRLVGALAEARIPTLVLKGPMLGERVHGDLGARVSADIDLLVDSGDLAAATAALSTLGYRPAPARASKPSRPDLHTCLRAAELPEVELHWRVHWFEEDFSSAMLQRAVPGLDCMQPSTPDELIALLLFYARDGMTGLRLLADLTAWSDRHGGAQTDDATDEIARENPAIVRALATAALTAMHLGGFPATTFFSRSTLAAASHRAMRLSNWPRSGKASQISANIAVVDCLLAPRGQRRALLARHYWRDELALRGGEWSQTALRGSALVRMRIMHLLRVSVRSMIALWRVSQQGELAPLPRELDSQGGDDGR